MGLHSMYARAPVVTPVRNGPTATRCPKEACTVRVAVKTIAYSDLQPRSCRLRCSPACHSAPPHKEATIGWVLRHVLCVLQ
jgi:hypothetical protein